MDTQQVVTWFMNQEVARIIQNNERIRAYVPITGINCPSVDSKFRERQCYANVWLNCIHSGSKKPLRMHKKIQRVWKWRYRNKNITNSDNKNVHENSLIRHKNSKLKRERRRKPHRFTLKGKVKDHKFRYNQLFHVILLKDCSITTTSDH